MSISFALRVIGEYEHLEIQGKMDPDGAESPSAMTTSPDGVGAAS